MPAKRMLFAILVASIVTLCVGLGSGPTGTALALPPVSQHSPSGLTIPYPGRLTGNTGAPVADAPYDFSFALYQTQTGGEPLWSEIQEGIVTTDGAFTALLGSVNPVPAFVMDGDARWLAVSVRGQGEDAFTPLAPRQRLSSTASTAASSPSSGAACPHDHFGEQWIGTGTEGLLVATDGYVGVEAWSDSYIGVAGISTPYSLAWPSGRAYGVYGYSYGDHGVYGRTFGDWGWRSGVYGEASKDHANGVTGWNTGAGVGVYGYSESGQAGYFTDTESSSGVPTVAVKKKGAGGSALSLQAWNPGGGQEPGLFIEATDESNVRQFVVAYNGVVAAAGYNTWGSDLAEMLPAVEGQEPGEVLVIGSDGKLTRSTKAYQTNVAGVYSTQPGIVAGQPVEGEVPGARPLAVTGVVPVKASTENGPIAPGDLLVASATPGHAMKAGASPPIGSVIGKALEGLDAPLGTGEIKILATLQ